jgi:hypothetical protein
MHKRIEEIPVASELPQAAVGMQECRRKAKQVSGEQASWICAMSVVLSVVLSKAGQAGEMALQGVRHIIADSWRASSMVEGINSVVRMQQARHRRLTQPMLELKRLYWNCRRFRAGRRRQKSPYELIGLAWPPENWWDVLKMTPEQLRNKLSAAQGQV